ncbi:MAG: hypothetical protein WCO78_01675 [Candidatus Roizmanbacteria bacterium]
MEKQIIDEFLIKLLKRAYERKISCYLAHIDIEVIKPICQITYVSEAFRRYFEEKIKDVLSPPTVLVYQKGSIFIASDDLNTLFLYREKKYKRIPCVVLGMPLGRHVLAKSKPFYLPHPIPEFISTK